MITEEVEKTEKRLKLEDFEIGEPLGNGKFGYVYKAFEKKHKKEVAIKVIRKNIIEQFNYHSQLKNEIEIHTRLK
jgi:aurora kinase